MIPQLGSNFPLDDNAVNEFQGELKWTIRSQKEHPSRRFLKNPKKPYDRNKWNLMQTGRKYELQKTQTCLKMFSNSFGSMVGDVSSTISRKDVTFPSYSTPEFLQHGRWQHEDIWWGKLLDKSVVHG